MHYFILLILAMIIFSYRIYYIKKRNPKFSLKEIFIFIFLLYLIIFIKFTLLKDTEFTLNLNSTLKQINLIPLVTLDYGIYSVLRTIFMTIPFGFFLSLFFPTTRYFKSLTRYAFTISIIIETLQLFKIHEHWNINDIIFYILGFLIGGGFFKILYIIVNHFSNTSVIKKTEVINLTPLRVGWKLTLLISITYIISLSSILIYQTYPLSILEKNKVIDIDCFQISLEEKSSYVNINGYYKTNFNRLNQLFSTKLQTNQEPIYGVYTLNEPYKSKNTTLYGILVVGWNQDATTIQITYNDKTYTEKINTGIFAVAYPDLVSNRPVLDIYTNFTSNLNVTFYDAYNNMIEIPFNQFLAEY